MMYRNQCTAKEKLMNRINEVSFAVNDVLLYLDTHPCCEEAISFYQECERICAVLWPTDSRCCTGIWWGYMEMGAAAIPMGNGRRVQIVYVEL